MGINTDFVTIWEWVWDNIDDVIKAKQEKRLTKKQEKSQYQQITMTRAQFVAYLKKEKLTATTDNLLDPNAEYHAHNPHMHSSAFWMLFKGISFMDITKWFSNIVHGWERCLREE